MRRPPLPESLGPFFSVAQARAAGVSKSRLRAADLEMPHRGMRAVISRETTTLESDLLADAKAFAPSLTEHMFYSHVLAAVGWGVPLPTSALTENLLDIAVFAPRRNPRGVGIRGHVIHTSLATRVVHPDHGIPLMSPASTWATLGSVLTHLYDLVSAADALVRTAQHPDDSPARTGRTQLAAAATAGRRVGVGGLREALPRVRDGASSRPETWTRLTLVDAGLPEPQLAYPVFDRDDAFIGRVDMAYPPWKVAVEYEGEQHLRDAAQWSKDILRYERLAAEGWTVIRVTKDELFGRPSEVADRVRRALARAAR